MKSIKCSWSNLKFAVIGLAFAGAVAANAQSVSSGNNSSGNWAVQVDATATGLVGNNQAFQGASDKIDATMDRAFVAVKVTSPDGKVQFSGIIDAGVLARDNLAQGKSPDHMIEELLATVKANDMLSISAGIKSIGLGAGLEYRGDRANIPLLSDQASMTQLKQRLAVEFGLTFETGTTMQIAIFDGTEQSAISKTGSFQASDIVDINMDANRLVDSASAALSIQQKLGKVLGNDVKIMGSYAKINDRLAKGTSEDRIALAAQIERQVGNWTLAALYQFAKVYGDKDLNSHLLEATAKNKQLTIFGRLERTEQSTPASKEKVTSASVGASYRITKEESKVALDPFAMLVVKDSKSRTEADVGFYLGVKASGSHKFEQKKSE